MVARLRLMGLAIRPGCTTCARPAARCLAYSPLSAKIAKGPGGPTDATYAPCSRQLVSHRIKVAVAAAGAHPSRLSGISARKGGISRAVEAGVDGEHPLPAERRRTGPGSVGVAACTRSPALPEDLCDLRPVMCTVRCA